MAENAEGQPLKTDKSATQPTKRMAGKIGGQI
jgi:hypothetical protein